MAMESNSSLRLACPLMCLDLFYNLSDHDKFAILCRLLFDSHLLFRLTSVWFIPQIEKPQARTKV